MQTVAVVADGHMEALDMHGQDHEEKARHSAESDDTLVLGCECSSYRSARDEQPKDDHEDLHCTAILDDCDGALLTCNRTNAAE